MPVDTRNDKHERTNQLSMEKFGYPVRNGLFVTNDFVQSRTYGMVSVIFPIGDDYKLFTNLSVRDYYGIAISPEKYIKDMVDITKGGKIPKTEIMFFGNAYMLPLSVALKYNLLKTDKIQLLSIDSIIDKIKQTNTTQDAIRILFGLGNTSNGNIKKSDIKKLVRTTLNKHGLQSHIGSRLLKMHTILGVSLREMLSWFDDTEIKQVLENDDLSSFGIEIFSNIKNKELLRYISDINLSIRGITNGKYYQTIELLCEIYKDKLDIPTYELREMLLNMYGKYKGRIKKMIPATLEYAADKFLVVDVLKYIKGQ